MIVEKQGDPAVGFPAAIPTPAQGPVSSEPTEDGGLEVTFGENPQKEAGESSGDHFDNLAKDKDDGILSKIAFEAIEGFEADVASRQDWETTLSRGIDLLGLRLDDSAQPFQGACNAVHPLVIENAVKFQAKAIAEIFPAGGPVKTQIVGVQNDQIIAAAQRVRDYMNFQLTEEMPEYFDETERMLFYLSLAGTAFKKTYYSPLDERPVAEFVKATDFIVSNYATDLRRAERYTHRMYMSKIDIDRLMADGTYVEQELGQPTAPKISDFEEKMNRKVGVNQNETPDRTPGYTILEQHCYLGDDFAVDDLPAPYVVTVEYNTKKILAIRRNWDENDKKRNKLLWFVKYSFVPSDGFYSFGLIHLIGGLAKTATLIMRSLADAGQFANMQGGFKLKGIKVVGGNDPIAPGEFKDVEVPNMQKLSDAIVPFTYKEPSTALFNLLSFIVTAGQKFADTTDMVVSDSTSYGPVGTILALLDASAKFFSSIHKRLHKSLREELKILQRINKDTLPSQYPYDVTGAQRQVFNADFAGNVNIIPVSDPNISTQAHRTAIAQAIVTMAQQAPQIHDIREAYRRVYTNMGIQDIEKILPPPPSAQQADPVTDLMSAVHGMPIQAFPGQDHQGHIAIKSAWLQDPMNGSNPMMAKILPVIQTNVQEHMVMQYQEQLSGLAQQATPQQPGAAQQPLPPQVMSQIMSQAAQQILQYNKSQATPDIDKALAEVEQGRVMVEATRVAHQREKDQIDGLLKMLELQLRQEKEHLNAAEKGAKIEVSQKDNAASRRIKLIETAIKVLGELEKPEKESKNG